MTSSFDANSRSARLEPPAADGEAPADLVDQLVEKVNQWTMMQFGIERRSHFLNTLAARTRATNSPHIAAYIRSVLAASGQTGFLALVDDLTINETTFYRNVPQMNLFANVAVPEIAARKRAQGGPKRLDIWSAACSTGQEVYTLAILAYEALRFLPAWNVHVYGTDISPSVIDVARRGVYPKARLTTMPPQILARYFEAHGDEIRVKDMLHRITSFQMHNLRDPFSPQVYDVIYCRNAMIYFSRDDQKALAERFRERIAPGGFLFIGHSESLQGLGVDFRMRVEAGGVAYQKPLEGKQ